ncbi:MAG: hypothetical protein QOG25_3341, partial [Acetobacteraceae bacterium]|nr:hypothetical protein [Acetobacteraceae bacterium]
MLTLVIPDPEWLHEMETTMRRPFCQED